MLDQDGSGKRSQQDGAVAVREGFSLFENFCEIINHSEKKEKAWQKSEYIKYIITRPRKLCESQIFRL